MSVILASRGGCDRSTRPHYKAVREDALQEELLVPEEAAVRERVLREKVCYNYTNFAPPPPKFFVPPTKITKF
jgi:hypothetical protein